MYDKFSDGVKYFQKYQSVKLWYIGYYVKPT